jgi:hypothetical protein
MFVFFPASHAIPTTFSGCPRVSTRVHTHTQNIEGDAQKLHATREDTFSPAVGGHITMLVCFVFQMASIVSKLALRSKTGRGLGIDIHSHTVDMIHFYWKKRDTECCYTHVYERRFFEVGEYCLIKDHIFKEGFSGACECLSTWLPPKDKHYQPCPFYI